MITADGKTLEQLEHVSTLNQIGLARELTLSVPADAQLTVAVPNCGAEGAVKVVAGDDTHYGVSLDRQTGQVAVRRSATPFGYA